MVTDQRVAIVTGAASGIGEAIAHRLHADGLAVVVADLDLAGAQRVATEIGGPAVATDVADEDDVGRLFALTVERYGHVNVVFNNAGIGGQTASIAELTVGEFDHLIAVNLRGVFLGTRAALRCFADRPAQYPAVVNTAALVGLTASSTQPAYTAAKHGVIGFSRAAAAQAARHGARVNAICPGMIDTPGLRALGGEPGAQPSSNVSLQRIPAQRAGTTVELAAAACWLASPEAAYINGIALPVDGGLLAVTM